MPSSTRLELGSDIEFHKIMKLVEGLVGLLAISRFARRNLSRILGPMNYFIFLRLARINKVVLKTELGRIVSHVNESLIKPDRCSQ